MGGSRLLLPKHSWCRAALLGHRARSSSPGGHGRPFQLLFVWQTFYHFYQPQPLEQLLTSDKLNPRLRRIAYKLQHWMIEIRYIPGDKNTFANALSREDRKSEEMPEMSPDVCLVEGDVEGQPPHKDEEERQQSQEDNLSGKP